MRRTSINLTDTQYNTIDSISKNTNRKRSEVLVDIINKVTASGDYDYNQRIYSTGRPIRRLTESARFNQGKTDVVAYTYAGALSYLEQDKMIALATQLYSQNPLAHRLIEILTDFCVGDPITWETEDSDLHDHLTRFWTHPRNSFHTNQHQRVSELFLYGEQFYPIFVDPISGLMQLGRIHPAFIKQTILDPDDCGFVIGVEAYTVYPNTRCYRTICSLDPRQFLNDQALQMRQEMDGDCFYFAMNALSLPMTATGYAERAYQNRGRSELLPVIDRLGMLDDLTYLNLDRIQILLSIIYDITVSKGSPKDIERILDEFDIPSGPAVRAHDDNMKIDVKTPRLGSSETSTLFKALQDEILGCLGIPSQWFGDSGNANRATAQSMELPTLKKLKSRQQVVGTVFRSILDYQVQILKKKNMISNDATYDLNIPAITRRDLVVVGDALNKSVANLEKAVQNVWIDNIKAGEIFREIAGGYGIELYEPENIEVIDEIVSAELQVPDKNTSVVLQKKESDQYHDYIALDNPDETREDKEERDMRKLLSNDV